MPLSAAEKWKLTNAADQKQNRIPRLQSIGNMEFFSEYSHASQACIDILNAQTKNIRRIKHCG